MPAPFTTPVALSVPFEPNRNPGFGGVPSGIQSEDVQNAIEEAKQDALDNDRYLVTASYGGNAGTGRYLEIFPTIDSHEAPLFLPVTSKLLTIVAQTTAAQATCTIGFYDVATPSPTLLYTVTFSGTKRVVVTSTPGTPLYTFSPNTELAIQVDSSSINKPTMYFFMSSAT